MFINFVVNNFIIIIIHFLFLVAFRSRTSIVDKSTILKNASKLLLKPAREGSLYLLQIQEWPTKRAPAKYQQKIIIRINKKKMNSIWTLYFVFRSTTGLIWLAVENLQKW